MRNVWQSLAWKEWHEHKWKLVSIVAVVWGVELFALCFNDHPANFELAAVSIFVCMIPLAVFIGLGAAANEQSRRTLPFLQALPVPMWRAASLKLLLGILTVLIPIALAVGLLFVWSQCLQLLGIHHGSLAERALLVDNWYLSTFLYCGFPTVSLFVWAAAAGVNRKDEISAGAVALVVMIGWPVLLVVGAYVVLRFLLPLAAYLLHLGDDSIDIHVIVDRLQALFLATMPGGMAKAIESFRGHQLLLCIFATIIWHLGLAAWYAFRFGRISKLEIRSPQVAKSDSGRAEWLSPPRHSVLSAIAWKQVRESGPLMLAGLVGVIGIGVAIVCGDPSFYARRLDQLATLLAGIIVSVGFLVALVVGIGVCLYDVEPRLSNFWRSRPINPDSWFWSKYLTGLLVLLASLYVPLVAIVCVVHPTPRVVLFDWPAVLMPSAHLAIFAAAVAMTCLVRHAVYAAILSIPAIYSGVLVVWLMMRVAHLADGSGRLSGGLWQMSELQVAAGFLLSFAICTPLAWLAMRYDWGWRSRY